MNSSSTKNCNKKSNCLDHSHGIRGGKSVSLRIQTEVSDLLPQDNATPIKTQKRGKIHDDLNENEESGDHAENDGGGVHLEGVLGIAGSAAITVVAVAVRNTAIGIESADTITTAELVVADGAV